MRKPFTYFIGGLIFLLLVPGSALAESARSLVESGNEAFLKGDYTTSLDKYEKAVVDEPDSAVVLFNKGDALYKQEKYDEAFTVFEQAAAKAMENNDHVLEAQSRYNLGNTSYRRAEAFSREDLQKALAEYERSSGYYQSAVRLNPDLSEAALNLEASRIAAKEVEALLRKQQQEARQQAQQKQDLAKELENLQKEQQNAAEQSRDLAQNQQQKDSNRNTAQQAANQESITDRTREAGEKLQQLNQEQKPELSGEMAREHMKRAVEKQEDAEKNLLQNKPSEAYENQQEAARELQNAMQQLEQGRKKSREQESDGREKAGGQAEAEQQKQMEQQAPAEETAQQNEQSPQDYGVPAAESPENIINEELENRKYRSARGTTGYKPVDKDW